MRSDLVRARWFEFVEYGARSGFSAGETDGLAKKLRGNVMEVVHRDLVADLQDHIYEGALIIACGKEGIEVGGRNMPSAF